MVLEGTEVEEVYKCSCGGTFDDLDAFRGHFVWAGKNEPGLHHSEGRVDKKTGQPTLPPYNQRTLEQKMNARAIRKDKSGEQSTGKQTKEKEEEKEEEKGKAKRKKEETPKQVAKPTETLQEAAVIRLQPRIYTIDLSPTLLIAYEAAQRLYRWPAMPLGDFIDTVVYRYFRSLGVHLAGFVTDESEEERQERERQIAQFNKEGNNGSET